MKAIVKYAKGDGHVDVRDVEEPVCSEKRIKLQIAYCGVCGTDLHVLHDTFPNFPPVILGHEFAGTVVEAGKGAGSLFREGDRVAGLGASAIRCGRCAYCLSGNFIFCSARRGMGHGIDGAFTRYVVMRPDQLFRIPAELTMEEAALCEPFAAAVHAVTEISTVRIGQTAVVSGPGPIGLMCLKLLSSQGIATIVAGTTHDSARLRAALRFGAMEVIDVGERNLADAVREITGSDGVDCAFECAGHESSIRACLQSLRPMGHYTQVGVCGRDVQMPMDLVFSKQLTVAGSVCYTERTWDRMMQILFSGRLRLDDMISTKLPISEWQNAFELCQSRQALKVLMYPID